MASDDRSEPDVPPPSPELQRLAPLLGTWKAQDQTQDTSLAGPGVPVTSTEGISWLDGGYFLVQTYDTAFGDEPVRRGVNYWGYDDEAKRFRIIFFSNNGRSPRTATGTKGSWLVTRSPSKGRPAFSTSSITTGRSSPTPTGPSPWRGGCATIRTTGSPG
jgi:hypothetical protein